MNKPPIPPEIAEHIGYKAIPEHHLLTKENMAPLLQHRSPFAHKGSFGHALLVAGSKGMMGAAQLAAKACLRSGVGLLTVHTPACGYPILQSCVPEAMTECDAETDSVSSLALSSLAKYAAVGIGPGIGRSDNAFQALKQLLQYNRLPILFDADALNLLSEHPTCLEFLPPFSVLTPHPGELERLIGRTATTTERLQKTQEFAWKHRCICLIKGAGTAIVCPNRQVFFNTTGNPGMATAGSGDVLSGIILGLMAQSYPTDTATCLGVFLHGLAGDLALAAQSEESLISSDLITHLGAAFQCLHLSRKP